MEMEDLFTYKNQLLASDGYTCITSTCQKVDWSHAFISASCLNLRTVKCPLSSNSPIKVALVGATTALLFYRGTATFSSWRVAAACDYWKKTPTKTTQQGHDLDWQCLHCIALSWSQDSSLHFILSSLMTSLLISTKSPWCRQIHDWCGITVTKCALCFLLTNWTQPEDKQIRSAVRCPVFACHLSFAARSVVKRALETQYSNKCFQPLQ